MLSLLSLYTRALYKYTSAAMCCYWLLCSFFIECKLTLISFTENYCEFFWKFFKNFFENWKLKIWDVFEKNLLQYIVNGCQL